MDNNNPRCDENDVFDDDDLFDLIGSDDGRPEMCRNCDFDCDEPDENGCQLMGL